VLEEDEESHASPSQRDRPVNPDERPSAHAGKAGMDSSAS